MIGSRLRFFFLHVCTKKYMTGFFKEAVIRITCFDLSRQSVRREKWEKQNIHTRKKFYTEQIIFLSVGGMHFHRLHFYFPQFQDLPAPRTP